MFLPQSEGSSKSIPEKLSARLRRLHLIHLLPLLGTMHDIMTLHRHRHSYLQECIDSMDFQWRQGSLTFHVYISFYLRTTCVFWCFGVLGKCYLIRPCLGSSKLDGLPSFEVQPHNFSFCERALPVTEVRSAFSALYQWQGTSTRRRCQLLF